MDTLLMLILGFIVAGQIIIMLGMNGLNRRVDNLTVRHPARPNAAGVEVIRHRDGCPACNAELHDQCNCDFAERLHSALMKNP